MLSEFLHVFPDAEPSRERTLATATQTALETLLNCDCPYQDLEHTMLVAEVGQTTLAGCQLAHGDLTAHQ